MNLQKNGTCSCSCSILIRQPMTELKENEIHMYSFFTDDEAMRRVRLCNILSRYLKCDPSEIKIGLKAQGKPFLEKESHSRLKFNQSHSENFVLIAINWDQEIGVDVERLRDLPKRDRLAKRYFSVDECEALQNAKEAERTKIFFYIWTRKEACLKALGKGLSVDLKSFSVGFGPTETWSNASSNLFVKNFMPTHNHVAAVSLSEKVKECLCMEWQDLC